MREGSEGGFKGSTEEENKNAAAGRSDWENGKDEESSLVFVKKNDVTFFECLTSNLLLQSSTFSESIIQSIIILSIFLFFIFFNILLFPSLQTTTPVVLTSPSFHPGGCC